LTLTLVTSFPHSYPFCFQRCCVTLFPFFSPPRIISSDTSPLLRSFFLTPPLVFPIRGPRLLFSACRCLAASLMTFPSGVYRMGFFCFSFIGSKTPSFLPLGHLLRTRWVVRVTGRRWPLFLRCLFPRIPSNIECPIVCFVGFIFLYRQSATQ